MVHACGLRTKCINDYHDKSNYWNKIFISGVPILWNTIFSRKEVFEQLAELFEN